MTRLTTLRSPLSQATPRLQPLQTGWRQPNATSNARGYGYAWQKARKAYLAEHPLCVMCQANNRITTATVVDHIVPHRGDQQRFWDQANWQPLCASCHSSAKQREEAELEKQSAHRSGRDERRVVAA